MKTSHILVACLLGLLFTDESFSSLPPPKKVAILGGGVSSCITALALSEQPDWQEKYDITIYQLDWKLGGKGSSGRNAEYGQRIEEHGIHAFFGYYFNAFPMIKKVYEELDRPEGSPLRRWEDVFMPIDETLMMDLSTGDTPWPVFYPTPGGSPAEGRDDCSLSQIIAVLGQQLAGNTRTLTNAFGINQSKRSLEYENLNQILSANRRDVVASIGEIQDWLQSVVSSTVNVAKELLESTRHLMIKTDMLAAMIKGILADGVLENGFDSINDIEFTEWLRKHGLRDISAESLLNGLTYELAAGYYDGNMNKPDMEAGTALRLYIMAACLRGHLMYFMRTGMGDAIFAPIYQVLKNRGVKIKFFHKVENLRLNPSDHTLVEEIQITKQVELVNDEYNPLIDVKGLPCWPNKPKYEEIVPEQSALLKQHNIKLDNFWSEWPQVYQNHFNEALPKIILKRGQDFDIVVYGMPVPTLGFYASELLEVSPELKATYENVGTVATQFLTLWFDKSTEELGYPKVTPGAPPVPLNIRPYPFRSYIAMDQAIWSEDWEALGVQPKHMAFAASVLNGTNIPPPSQTDFLEEQTMEVKENYLSAFAHFKDIMPNAFVNGKFDWSVLTDPQNRTGEERFNSQYWRSNVDPSERYTVSFTNTSKYRITPDGAGFQNVYFTGDWIRNIIKIGSVEGSTQSALLTSRAISGYPEKILFEDDWW